MSLFVAILSCVPLLASREARAVGREQCFSAHEDGQAKRSAGKLSEARADFMTCGDVSCPDAVRADCAGWVIELDAAQPSVMFVVLDAAGNDVADVSVSVDGATLLTKLDGKPVPLDPGPHEITFEAPGSATFTEHVVIREGEKSRRIDVRLREGSSSGGAKATPADGSGGGGGIHPAAWVLGGVGIVGVGVFAVLAGLGKSELSDAEAPVAEGGCAPTCSDERLDPIKTKYLVGDISLFVGLGALSAGIVVAIVSATSTPDQPAAQAIRVRAVPTVGGAYLGLEGSFL